MVDKPLLTSDEVSVLQAGALGAFLSLLFQGKITWQTALLIFASGEVCAFYFAPIASHATGWNEGAWGLTIGFAAMFICGGFINLLKKFRDDPWGILRGIPFLQAFIGKDKP